MEQQQTQIIREELVGIKGILERIEENQRRLSIDVEELEEGGYHRRYFPNP